MLAGQSLMSPNHRLEFLKGKAGIVIIPHCDLALLEIGIVQEGIIICMEMGLVAAKEHFNCGGWISPCRSKELKRALGLVKGPIEGKDAVDVIGVGDVVGGGVVIITIVVAAAAAAVLPVM